MASPTQPSHSRRLLPSDLKCPLQTCSFHFCANSLGCCGQHPCKPGCWVCGTWGSRCVRCCPRLASWAAASQVANPSESSCRPISDRRHELSPWPTSLGTLRPSRQAQFLQLGVVAAPGPLGLGVCCAERVQRARVSAELPALPLEPRSKLGANSLPGGFPATKLAFVSSWKLVDPAPGCDRASTWEALLPARPLAAATPELTRGFHGAYSSGTELLLGAVCPR